MFKKYLLRWETAVFAFYISISSIAVSRHEPWFDEAQAWLLARDAGVGELLFRYLRYEGSPGLWHLLLMIPAQLRLPYISLNVLSGLLAAAGVYLFLYHSPLPACVRTLFPFTYFALYQYAAVSRSYALIPVLLFSIALMYRQRIERPFLYLSLLCLLAFTSLHGLVVASSLMLLHVYEFNRQWFDLDKRIRLRHIISVFLFGGLCFLTVLLLRKPPDIVTVAWFNADMSRFFRVIVNIFSDALSTNIIRNGGVRTRLTHLAELLAKGTLVLTLFWMIVRKRLMLFLVPITGLGLLFTIVYNNAWHQGVVLYLWLFALWVSCKGVESADLLARGTRKLMTLAVILVFAMQMTWAYNTLRYDYRNNYSASREAAAYIKENHIDEMRIFATRFHSISILPYFDRNIYCNYNDGNKPAFWFWSRQNEMYSQTLDSIPEYHPDWVLYGVKYYLHDNKSDPTPKLPEIEGFRLVKVFNGGLYWKERMIETDSFALYKKQ